MLTQNWLADLIDRMAKGHRMVHAFVTD